MPEQVWSKFIDAYRMLGMVVGKGNPHRSRKDILLEKAQNRTITHQENVELTNILEREAKQAQTGGDFLKLLIIMGILIFLASLFSDE